MPVRIVTDSTADLPPEVATGLGITVVPVYVRFGRNTYRDGVDIAHDEVYRKLATGRFRPTTSQPLPADFAKVYRKLAQEADGIVSVHVGSKLSGTFQSAAKAKELVGNICPIEVVDSRSVSMGLGLIAMAAARLAAAGESLQRVLFEIKEAVPKTRLLALLDSLRYLFLGGRIGDARALLGSVLNVKPVITLRDGEFRPVGQARTRARGVERLFQFAGSTPGVQELAIVHSTTPEEASALHQRLGSLFGQQHVHLARLGPALGVHGGPGTLAVMLRGEKASTPRRTSRRSE